MTIAEAIKRLETCDDCGDCLTCKAHDEAIEVVVTALKEQDVTDINVGNKWINVKERLPKSRADVLVVAYWGEEWQTMTGWYSAMMGKWRIITPFGEREPGGVTHWMPMPEPPKEDAE